MTNPYYKQHWIEIDDARITAYDQILGFHPALEPLLRPLDLKPGAKLLDVGSGPGHTTLELARRVGASGEVTGVDINADFVAAATIRARENSLPVKFVHSAFPPLPFADASFNRVLCKNVLEYVDSAQATVLEMARVAARGAVVVAIDSDWDMLALDLPASARERSERVIAAAKSIAVNEPKIGRRLYGLFQGAGLREVKVNVLAGADTSGRGSAMLKVSLARYAKDSGKVSVDEVEQWLRDIDEAIAQGRFFFVLPQFVASGVKG